MVHDSHRERKPLEHQEHKAVPTPGSVNHSGPLQADAILTHFHGKAIPLWFKEGLKTPRILCEYGHFSRTLLQ